MEVSTMGPWGHRLSSSSGRRQQHIDRSQHERQRHFRALNPMNNIDILFKKIPSAIRKSMITIEKQPLFTTKINSFTLPMFSSSSSSMDASSSNRYAVVLPEDQDTMDETDTADLTQSSHKNTLLPEVTDTAISVNHDHEVTLDRRIKSKPQKATTTTLSNRSRENGNHKIGQANHLFDRLDDEATMFSSSSCLTPGRRRGLCRSSNSGSCSNNGDSNKWAQLVARRKSSSIIEPRNSVPPIQQYPSSTTKITATRLSSSLRSGASSSSSNVVLSSSSKSTAAAATALTIRPLVFWENMICGAISRSIAQTVMHPANTMKTILQSSSSSSSSLRSLIQPSNFRRLTQGAGANLVLSVPHGAINFAVLELVRHRLQAIVQAVPSLKERADAIGPGLDFMSSAISTVCCSIVSTPQMMICDNIMAGNYQNLPQAVQGLMQRRGIAGFYAGWWPGLVGKIPSYALTWTFFQQLKKARYQWTQRPARNIENSVMGCIASATTVTIMIPMDTIKTRLVAQTGRSVASTTIPYKGIVDCATRVLREEGVGAFYRGLPPRLISVVPMIGIQFGVYEAMRRFMVQQSTERTAATTRTTQANITPHGKQKQPEVKRLKKTTKKESTGKASMLTTMPELQYGREQVLEEALMEVAADENQPNPAPHFLIKIRNGLNSKNGNGMT